jgi:hypothetical protein
VTQRRLVAGALTLVVLAVIGLLYLQALSQGRATREAWMVTRDLPAGAVLDANNLKHVHIPAAGDQFIVLTDNPANRRVARAMRAQTLLSPSDVLSRETVQVPVSVRAAPSVASGDTVDVYAVVGTRAVLVGRQLIVVATGNPLTMLVSANDEPYWIALQANNVSLFASKSDGVGVPDSGGVGVNDAIAGLTGSAQSGGVLINGAGTPTSQGTSNPLPTASPSVPPTSTASPKPSPR